MDRDNLFFNTKALDALSRISDLSFYVIDYHNQSFRYVSPHPLFLCGHTPEEVIRKGCSFYEEALPAEDLNLLLELNYRGFRLFHDTPQESRGALVISYDFRLKQPGGPLLMVNHKLTPITLTPSGDIHYALCIVALSPSSTPGNAFIRMNDELRLFRFSPISTRLREETIITLTEREREVLQLSAEGYPSEAIGEKLFVSTSTVKWHKARLFEKFNAKNITEAILFAQNNWLL